MTSYSLLVMVGPKYLKLIYLICGPSHLFQPNSKFYCDIKTGLAQFFKFLVVRLDVQSQRPGFSNFRCCRCLSIKKLRVSSVNCQIPVALEGEY